MGEESLSSLELVETLAKVENEYFLDNLNREDMLSIIKDIRFRIERAASKYNKEKDVKSMVSLFLILERLKKYLVFENFVLNLVDSELNALSSSFEQLSSTNYDSDTERSASNEDIKFELISSNATTNGNKKNNDEIPSLSERLKNKRANYPKKISRVLKNWLKENMNNPYPSESEKAMLMELTGLDTTQINNWFINARRRILPYMKSKYIKYE